MKRGILLTISLLLLAQCVGSGGIGTLLLGSEEAACVPVFKVESIHPLPEWDGQESIRSGTIAVEEDSHSSRLKISFPVALLTTLIFFLMWKLLQGQE